MKRIVGKLKIDNCLDCDYYNWGVNRWCEKEKRKIEKFHPIPTWCLLPEAGK